MVGIRRLIGRAKPPPRPTPLPVLPLLAALLLTLAAVQMGSWTWQIWESKGARVQSDVDAVLTGNPFKDMAVLHPKARMARSESVHVRRVVLPAEATNLQFGDPQAKVVVTVMSDPACGPCRARVQSWLKQLPRDTRVVYKFWPQDPFRLTPGMLVELARRQGVAGGFWARLENTEGDMDDAALLTMLEQAGVGLGEQRAALQDPDGALARVLEADIERGKALRLPSPPVLVMNGYVVDGQALFEDKLAVYAERLKADQPLTQDSDYWLMEVN